MDARDVADTKERVESLAVDIREGYYRRVRYVDSWGRHVAHLDELVELLPEWVDIHAHAYRSSEVENLRPVGIGPGVWQTASWPGLAGLGRLYLPTVFSVGERVYAVRMDVEPILEPGEVVLVVAPFVVEVDGQLLANIDLCDQVFHIGNPRYLIELRTRALVDYAPISLILLHASGHDIATVRLVEGRRWDGVTPGAVALRARPVDDMDFVETNLLCGEDGGRVFLSELPERVGSLDAAYAALNPLTADEQDLPTLRRGAWWFLPDVGPEDLGPHGRPLGEYERSTGVTARPVSKRERMKRLARRKPGQHPPGDFDTVYVGKLATLHEESDHFAQEVVRGEQGDLFVRGWLRHRIHSHAPIKLDQWHRAYHNGQVGAWSMSGPHHD